MVKLLIIVLITVALFGLYDIKRQSRAKRALPRGEHNDSSEEDRSSES